MTGGVCLNGALHPLSWGFNWELGVAHFLSIDGNPGAGWSGSMELWLESQRSKLFLIKSKQYQFVRQLSCDGADIAGCCQDAARGQDLFGHPVALFSKGGIRRVAKLNYQVASPSAALTWPVHLYPNANILFLAPFLRRLLLIVSSGSTGLFQS